MQVSRPQRKKFLKCSQCGNPVLEPPNVQNAYYKHVDACYERNRKSRTREAYAEASDAVTDIGEFPETHSQKRIKLAREMHYGPHGEVIRGYSPEAAPHLF